MRRPRWLDWRILVGIVLVVGAVVLGARVIGASSRLTPVWAAATDLAAGKVITAADLRSVDVNLGDSRDLYVPADEGPRLLGHQLTQSLNAGQLVPAAAVTAPTGNRVIVVNVDADQLPDGVAAGSKIDLYLTTPGAAGAAATTRLLSEGLTVQTVVAPASGGLSGATSESYKLSLLLDRSTAQSLTQLLPTGQIRVVLDTDR